MSSLGHGYGCIYIKEAIFPLNISAKVSKTVQMCVAHMTVHNFPLSVSLPQMLRSVTGGHAFSASGAWPLY